MAKFSPENVILKFVNRTEASCNNTYEPIELLLHKSAVPKVMDWYGAYYAGDDYDVFVNGRKQNLGINGELEPITIEAQNG